MAIFWAVVDCATPRARKVVNRCWASKSTESYRSDVGMEVNAAPLNLSPSAARFPILAVKSTEPSAPATPARPGRSLRTTAVLAWAASGILDVPMVLP